jgi:MFS superfamily sulfate permease-like transporter
MPLARFPFTPERLRIEVLAALVVGRAMISAATGSTALALARSPRPTGDPPHVLIDFSHAHLWDASAIAALDTIETPYRKHGVEVAISGLNEPSGELHGRLSGQLAPAH